MKKLQLILLFLAGSVLISCGPRVSTAKMTNKDLSIYDTFAYLPSTGIDMPAESFDDETVNEAVIETVNQNLREAGYVLDRENPDLLVLISTKTDVEVGTTTDAMFATYPYATGVTTVSPFYDPYYYSGFSGFNEFVGYDVDTYRYKQGAVIINLVDRETRETVWKGVASESIFNQPTVQAIQELVNAIFEEYPLIQNM